MKKMHFPSFLTLAVVPTRNLIEVENQNTSSGNEMHITGGTESILLKMISDAMKFNYKVVVPADKKWGRRAENGQWSGMFGMLQRNEADIAMSEIGIFEKRYEAVDFSYPYSIERITFASKSVKNTFISSTLLEPFAFEVWICLIITVLLVSLISRYILPVQKSFQRSLQCNFGAILNQSGRFECNMLSASILVSFWILGAMLLASCYTSMLLSFLTVPFRESYIDTNEQLLDALISKKYKCVTFETSSAHATLFTSNDQNIRTIADFIQDNHWFIQDSTSDIHGIQRSLSEGRVAYIGTSSSIEILNQRDLHISSDSIAIDLVAVAVNKKFCCKESLDRVIHGITAAGLYKKIYKDVAFKSEILEEIHEIRNETSVAESIKLRNLSFAFYILISGCALSVGVLVGEIVFEKKISKT